MTLPVRVRLTGWYVGLLAAILAAIGVFLPLRLAADLVAGIDRNLDAAAAQISSGSQGETESGFQDAADASLSGLPVGETAAQTLSVGGAVLLHAGDAAAQSSMLSPVDLRRVLAGGRIRAITRLGADRERYRLLATGLPAAPGRQALVIAIPLEDADRSVHRVLVLLLTVVPLALVAADGGAWWLARKALMPVSEISRQAEAIGVEQLHERVPVPATSDELARLARTVNAMLERIEGGVREKRRFLADASHELRMSLAVMRTELEVSLRSAEEVDRMSRIVDDLLTLARFDEGKLSLSRTDVDLRGVAGEVAQDLRPLAEPGGIEIEVFGPAVEVSADRERVYQAVRNLVENAVKYTQPGGRVQIDVWLSDGEAGLTVSDTGPGIPGEVLPRIFDRFVRADAARSRGTGGSGLGLAISREVVEAHGGRVWAESEVGAGSAFSIAFSRPGGAGG